MASGNRQFLEEFHIDPGASSEKAEALAQAQAGIAMGTGTDVAMESAEVTLVKGDLRRILRARLLSRATMKNIKQNLFFAFIYNALGIPIAAGVLYPFAGILLSPIFASLWAVATAWSPATPAPITSTRAGRSVPAAAAMSFSSVSVIGNALRLRAAEI